MADDVEKEVTNPQIVNKKNHTITVDIEGKPIKLCVTDSNNIFVVENEEYKSVNKYKQEKKKVTIAKNQVAPSSGLTPVETVATVPSKTNVQVSSDELKEAQEEMREKRPPGAKGWVWWRSKDYPWYTFSGKGCLWWFPLFFIRLFGIFAGASLVVITITWVVMTSFCRIVSASFNDTGETTDLVNEPPVCVQPIKPIFCKW